MRSCNDLLLIYFLLRVIYIYALILFLLCIHHSPSIGEKEAQMTGIYDLVAVLTHKGRSADSGHYVGWVKQENGWF